MGLETMALATLTAGALGGGAQFLESRRQRKTAEKGDKDTARRAVQTAKEEERERSVQNMRLRRRRGATGRAGTRPTILTTPTGVATGTPTGGKTLLGA